MPDRIYTVGYLHFFLDELLKKAPQYADRKVMMNVWSWEEGDLLAYVTNVAPIHTYLPDGEGGPDIEEAGSVLQIEGFYGPEEDQ